MNHELVVELKNDEIQYTISSLKNDEMMVDYMQIKFKFALSLVHTDISIYFVLLPQ
jgi:hypothetical protein